MDRNEVIKYCLELPNTYEDYPFPDDNVSITMKHKNNNKWFAQKSTKSMFFSKFQTNFTIDLENKTIVCYNVFAIY